jgi:hypothetical protein
MPIKPRDDLPPAPTGQDGLHDEDREIEGGPVFALDEVKAFVGSIDANAFRYTQKAADDMMHALRWSTADLVGFIQCLERRHYSKSLWCYGSAKAKIAFPADVYIMGYNRIRREEWLKCDPWNYFKFSISPKNNTVQIFSIHPQKNRR